MILSDDNEEYMNESSFLENSAAQTFNYSLIFLQNDEKDETLKHVQSTSAHFEPSCVHTCGSVLTAFSVPVSLYCFSSRCCVHVLTEKNRGIEGVPALNGFTTGL